MQINIKYVNFPRPGTSGKWGSIVDQDGTKVMVAVDRLDEFRAGQTVEVATKEQTWFRGTPDEAVVQVATGGPEGSTRPVQRQGGQASYQRPSQGQGFQRSNTGFQPRVVQGGRMPDQFDPAKDLHIFVTGVVQQAMNSGKFSASEIPVLTQAAIEAYDRLLARVQGKQTSRPLPPELAGEPLLEPGDPGPELQ